MLCKNPYLKGVLPCRCLKCMPCRIYTRRMWAQRLMLETESHYSAAFVTLTYRDEELSDVRGALYAGNRPVVGNLEPRHLQLWLKRIRSWARTRLVQKLRFYGVGEYGEVRGRPHYHIALYGFPRCFNGRTVYSKRDPTGALCCPTCKAVAKTWTYGRIEVGELNQKSAGYLAGYITKKWTKEDSWTREKLKGRRPEFARMSLNPGIGAIAIKRFATSGAQNPRVNQFVKSIDAPVALRNHGRMLPLGRYLKGKWREALGRDKKAPPEVLDRQLQELYGSLHEARQMAEATSGRRHETTAREAYFEKFSQPLRSFQRRFEIFKTRRKL